jgi:hypothetical protein
MDIMYFLYYVKVVKLCNYGIIVRVYLGCKIGEEKVVSIKVYEDGIQHY